LKKKIDFRDIWYQEAVRTMHVSDVVREFCIESMEAIYKELNQSENESNENPPPSTGVESLNRQQLN